MIKLTSKVSVPTASSIADYDIIIRMKDFTIVDGVRLLPNTTQEYLDAVASLDLKNEELASTPLTQVVTRQNLIAERQEILELIASLSIKDEGVCVCTLRYFASDNGIEIPLPIQGLTESYSCYVSELEDFSSMYDNVFLNKKHQMKQMVVRFLASTSFLGFDQESNFIIL